MVFGQKSQPRPQGFSRPTHFLREKPWGQGWKNRGFLSSVFFGQIKPGKIVFDILDKNECFWDQKKKVLKIDKKIGIFQKELDHSFCQKIELFIICVF